MRRSALRTQFTREKVESYTYKRDCAEVWPTLRMIMFEEGYSVRDTGEATLMTLESNWKVDSTFQDGTQWQSRILAQGGSNGPDSCQVAISQQQMRDSKPRGSSRHWEMEWKLLQRIDPADAENIRDSANDYAEQNQ